MSKIGTSVAVVILNWNGKSLLEEFLPSVVATAYPNAVIYVADNGSTDDSCAFVSAHFPSVKLIKLGENHGFSGGYNRAINQIEEDYTVLLNSDVAVAPNWLDDLVKVLDENPAIGIVQPKILQQKKPTHFEYAGACGGFWDRWGYPFCRGRLIDELEEDQEQYEDQTDVCWAGGCALVIRTSLYKRLGGLDEDFFAHFEEIDLCWRVWRSGSRIRVVPSSVVYHVGGATLGVSPRKTFLNFRNSLVFLLKNASWSYFIEAFIARLVLDGVAGLVYLLRKQPEHIWPIIKAHWDFFLRFPFWLKKRRETQKILHGFTPIEPPAYGFSIIFRFFIKKQKHFTQLFGLIENKKQ